MAKKSLFRRFMDLMKARFGGWVDKQEDVGQLIQQQLEEYQEQVEEHFNAVAQVMTAQKLVEKDYEEQKNEAERLKHAAHIARSKMERAKRDGDTENEEKYRDLATEAFKRYKEILTVSEDMKVQVEEGRIQVQGVRAKHEAVKNKADELKRKKRYLESRLKVSEARKMINDLNRSLEAPSSSFIVAEERIQYLEAENDTHEELATNTIEEDLQELMSGAHAHDDELEAFLSGNDKNLELTTGQKS